MQAGCGHGRLGPAGPDLVLAWRPSKADRVVTVAAPLNLLTGLKTEQKAFGQPLNINATNFYRAGQIQVGLRMEFHGLTLPAAAGFRGDGLDRKSTRLNSSHLG